ncbi:MAG: hypothetical protein R3B84_09370 [Zavarzinella sp.]
MENLIKSGMITAWCTAAKRLQNTIKSGCFGVFLKFTRFDWLLKLPDELEIDFNKVRFELLTENQMPYVTSFERIAKEEGIKIGEERGRDEGIKVGRDEGKVLGLRIGQIQLLQEVLGLPLNSAEEFQQKSIDELDRRISELKAKLIP